MELCDLVNSNIGLCADKTFRGFNKLGWWTLYDNIDQKSISITDGIVTFFSKTPFYELYDGSEKPFDGTKIGVEKSSKHGYNLTNQTVIFPLRANTVDNNLLVTALGKDTRIVVILDQKGVDTAANGKYPIFGLSGGLRLKTPVQDWTADVAWDLEFEDKNTTEPLLFSDIQSISIIKDFDLIYGGIIANGGAVKLTIDSDKTGYIKLPNGTILTTVAGVINTTYTGIGGSITYYVPKNSSVSIVENSGLSGSVTTNFANIIGIEGSNGLTGLTAPFSLQIGCRNMPLFANLVAPKVFGLAASGSALTAKSISDILYAAYVDNRENVVFDFSGGTNADFLAVEGYYEGVAQYGSVETHLAALRAAGGVITITDE